MSLFDADELAPVEPTFSVGELADRIGNAVRASFRDEVWVRGEIHDLSRPPSGHVYLTLVEQRPDGSKACLSVILSAAAKVGVNRSLKLAGGGVRMVDGTDVRIRGRLDWYSPRGQLQLRMTAIDPSYTLGQLEVARAELLARLGTEGLLRRNAGRPLAVVPLRVGLVTSAGSAAEADFLDELRRSGLSFSVAAVDVRVQGRAAARHVAAAVTSLSRRGCDAIAVVRGGGARTDLAAFDDELVARAIALSDVPVITGIGHEVDHSVSDDVAHTSAKTPTACARVLVERVLQHLGHVEAAWSAIARNARRDLLAHDERLSREATRAARSARAALAAGEVALDTGAERARRAATSVLAVNERHLEVAGRRASGSATVAISRAEQRSEALGARALGAARAHLREAGAAVDRVERGIAGRAPRAVATSERAVDALAARVRALDPEQALRRGWSITRTGDGRLVRGPADVAAGESLVTQTAGGDVRSTVDGDG